MIKNLMPVEYSAQPIVTTEQLAQFYECDRMQIIQNFNNNKEHFTEGKHFFKIEGEELKKLRIENFDLQISPMTRTLYLWTKRGAARHAKMLGTEKAWDVFELLEENYFNAKKSASFGTLMRPADVVDEIGLARDSIKNVFGVRDGIALAQATSMVEEFFGKDLTQLKKLLPPADHDTGFLNATQLGEKLGGLKARAVNKMLEKKGFQYRENNQWRLTYDGETYGEEMPYSKNGHSGYQIRWNDKVLSVLEV